MFRHLEIWQGDTATDEQIAAAYETYQADLARYNLYRDYATNFYNEEFLGEGYVSDDTLDGKTYLTFRQEAVAEAKFLNDYNLHRYRYQTGQEYWWTKAEEANKLLNGYQGSLSLMNEFYLRSYNGDPRNIYFDRYLEYREEYFENLETLNQYSSYVTNWEVPDYEGYSSADRKDDVFYEKDDWNVKIASTELSLNGQVVQYQNSVDQLNALIDEIKREVPSDVALQILSHLTTAGAGGIIIAGDGDDDITIGRLDPTVENPNYGNVFAMGQGGDDTYKIESFRYTDSYNDTKPISIEILDHEKGENGNTIRFMENVTDLKSGNIGIYANVTLLKDENGAYIKDENGNYEYTLENFRTYSGQSSGYWSYMERTPLKNGDAGYALLLVDAETYSNKYAFDSGAVDQGGLKLDIETLNNLDKIYASDGKYVTRAQLDEMFQNTANTLANLGYSSFMDALCLEGVYDDSQSRQASLAVLTGAEAMGSLEWIDPTEGVIAGATTGTEGTNTNDNLTSTNANETFNLKLGNDTITFTSEFGDEFGNDIIQSSSTVDNKGNARQIDTLNLKGYSVKDGTLKFSVSGDNLVITAYDGETVKGTVTYKDFLNTDYTSRYFMLNAQDMTYKVGMVNAGEAKVQYGATISQIEDNIDNYNHIKFIRSTDGSTINVIPNANRGYYYTLGETPISIDMFNSTYSGKEVKEIFSNGQTNDVYDIALKNNMNNSVVIHDAGGNDKLYIAGHEYNNYTTSHYLRFFFDMDVNGTVSDAKHIIYLNNFYVPSTAEDEYGYETTVYSYATDNLIKLLNNDPSHMDNTVTFIGDLEKLSTYDHEDLAENVWTDSNEDQTIKLHKYIESVAIDVVPWLAENHYASVKDALTQLKAGIDEKQAAMDEIDLSNVDPEDENTIPAEYTQLKEEQDALQAKIDELLGFYNKQYDIQLYTNMLGTTGDDEITSALNGITKYVEGKQGNDIVDLSYAAHSTPVEYYYDFERGDGHDTLIYSYKYDSICINKGSSEMYTRFRTDGWDLKIELYSDNEATSNLKGSILIKDYFYNLINNRIDKLVIKSAGEADVEYSIDTLLRQEGAVLNEGVKVAFGTTDNDPYTGTSGNDVYYINDDDDTIICSAGDDIYYLSEFNRSRHGNSTFTYTIGNGDDVIYGSGDVTKLTLNYNNEDISMEFRENGDDLRMVFFNYAGVDRGSITIKDYKTTSSLCFNHPDDWVNTFFIKKNNSDEGTPYRLNDLIKNYTDMGGSFVENNDEKYINVIRITAEDNGRSIDNSSGKVDRLVFDAGVTVTSAQSGNDLVLTYDTDKTVTIKDYVTGNSSVYDVKIGNTYTTLGDLSGLYYGTTGDDTFIHSTEADVVRTYNLNTGNDIVEFTKTRNASDAYENGTVLYNKAVINSTGGTQYTDTIKLMDYQIYGNNNYAHTKLFFGLTDDGNNLTIKGERDFNPTTLVNYHKYTDITYNNFFSADTPNLRIEMNYDEYSSSYYNVHKYLTAQTLDMTSSFEQVSNTANILYIKDTNTNHTSNITSTSDCYAQIVTAGGAALNYTGCADDIIVTNSTTSNDTYNVTNAGVGTGMNLFITDKGGTNDTLNLQGMNSIDFANLFLAFNVSKDGSMTDENFTLTFGYKDQYSNPIWNTATQVLTGDKYLLDNVITVEAAKQNGKDVGIEHVYAYDYNQNKLGEINMENWYKAVKADVVAWLSNEDNAAWMLENNLNSTADVFNFYNNDNSSGYEKAQSLINVYENRNASMYV